MRNVSKLTTPRHSYPFLQWYLDLHQRSHADLYTIIERYSSLVYFDCGMGGVRRRKSRRKARINCTNYGKKHKMKTKLPSNVMKNVKEKWDHKKSMRENLKSLDLVYDANELLPIAVPKEVPMEESDIPSSTSHKLPKLTSTTQQKTVHITPNRAEFLQTMISRHSEDYEKMARDKRNIYQLTPGQLRKQCLQFIESRQHTVV